MKLMVLVAAAGLAFSAAAQTLTATPSQVSRSFSTNAVQGSVTVMIGANLAASVTISTSTDSGGNWLSVGQSSGIVTPGNTLSVVVNLDPSGLPDGTYTAVVMVTSPTSATIRIPVAMLIGDPGPQLAGSMLLNGAPLPAAGLWPGAILTVTGSEIGPRAPYEADIRSGVLQSRIAGTRLWFDNVAAQLVYAHPGEVAAIVPYSVAGKASVQISVESLVARSLGVTVPVQSTGAGCQYGLSPAALTVVAAGGDVSIAVGASAVTCSWAASTDAAWLTCKPALAGSGTGVLVCTAEPNLSLQPRSATITVAGVKIGIGQQAGVPAITAVVNGGFGTSISSSSWVTIQGQLLSASTRTWNGSDFQGDNLPTSLDGVSVTINSVPAYIYYISPTQLNVLAPDDPATGIVQVQVSWNNSGSKLFTVTKGALAPALFLYTAKYPAAIHLNGQGIGEPSLIPGGSFSPASPGETIELFGTGFGPTNPVTPAGQILTVPTKLANSVSVTVGGLPAQVSFGGVVSNGLDQLNITLPAGLPSGDAALVATVGGVKTQSNLFLTIQR